MIELSMKLLLKPEQLHQLICENKLMILQSLYNCDDVCGCDLVDKLGIRKNLLSYHLKGLKNIGYISEIRCGKYKRYQLNKNSRDEVRQLLQVTGTI